MSEMSTFGARLRDLRVKSGLSQEEAAAQLGVSPQSVSKWETDKCYPEFSLIMPLARLYGVSADMLLGNEDRRAYWEEKWQEALRQGGEKATLPVTEAALRELPGDRQFRYRQGCTEFFIAVNDKTKEDRDRWLAAAEKHLRALHEEEPMSESSGGMLVTVLMTQGRLQEAEDLCRTIPNGERELQFVLRGEAQKKQRRTVLTKDFFILINDLLAYETPSARDAAERIILDALGAEGFYADRLLLIRWEQAKSALEGGEAEKAMAALQSMRDLTARWAGAGGYDKAPEKAPFLEPHVPMRHEEHLWANFLSFLRAEALDPLRDREDFRALLAEAEREAAKDTGFGG